MTITATPSRRSRHGPMPLVVTHEVARGLRTAESYLKAQHVLFFGAPVEGDFMPWNGASRWPGSCGRM